MNETILNISGITEIKYIGENCINNIEANDVSEQEVKGNYFIIDGPIELNYNGNPINVNDKYIPKNSYENKTVFRNIHECGTYALLRTNPKITGNIKLVIDSASNMYIDSFRANNTLSKNKYHKVPVSYKSYYGRDIMSVFRDVPTSDLYATPDEYNSIYTKVKNYKDQFADIYRSGAETNTDNLYSESFSILAPLKIGAIVPDFFVVFRVDNSVPHTVDKKDIFKYLIKHGKQIKAFDLRETSNVGKYLRESQTHANDVISDIYMSRTKDTWNRYYGISIDSGVVTSAIESVDRHSPKSLIDMDYMLTTGFERNRLVSANTLNIEFKFDDDSVDQFSTNTYFGVYIYANVLKDDIYYLKNSDGTIKEYNESDEEIPSDIYDEYEGIMDDVILGYTTEFGDGFYRTNTENKEDILKLVSNRLGKNVIYCNADKLSSDNNKCFITFKINELLKSGEHIRIINTSGPTNSATKDEVYEIIVCDNATKNANGISEETLYNKSYTVTEGSITYTKHTVLHAIAINAISKTSEDETNEYLLNRQTLLIRQALNSFKDNAFDANSTSDMSISIIYNNTYSNSSDEKIIFERVSSKLSNDFKNGKKELQKQAEQDKNAMVFYGDYIANPIIVNLTDEKDIIYDNSTKEMNGLALIPHFFEFTGIRIIYAVEFININQNSSDSTQTVLYEGTTDITDAMVDKKLCFMNKNGDVVEYTKQDSTSSSSFNISIAKASEDKIEYEKTQANYIYSYNNPSKYLFRFNIDDVPENISNIALYRHSLVDYVLCGIFPTIDYDSTIVKNEKNDTFESSISLYNYFSVYTDFDVSIKEEDKLKQVLDSGVRSAAISPIINTLSTWVGVGTDTSCDKLHIPYDHIYKIDSSVNEDSNDFVANKSIEYDLSKSLNEKSVRDMLISGEFSIDEITHDVGIVDKYKIEEKLYKTSNDTLTIISNGVMHNIKVNGVNSEDITTAADNTHFFIVNSPFTDGATSYTELFIDTELRISMLVIYGGSTTGMIKVGTSSIEKDTSTKIYKLPFWIEGRDISFDSTNKMCIDITEHYNYVDEIKTPFIVKSDNIVITGDCSTIMDASSNTKTIECGTVNVTIIPTLSNSGVLIFDDVYDTSMEPNDIDFVLSKNEKLDMILIGDASTTEVVLKTDTKNKLDTMVYIKNGDTNFVINDDINAISIGPKSPITKYLWKEDDSSVAYYPCFITQNTNIITNFEDIEIAEGVDKKSCIYPSENECNMNMCFYKKADNTESGNEGIGIGFCENYNLCANTMSYDFYCDENGNNEVNGLSDPTLMKTFFNSLAIQRKKIFGDENRPEITLSSWYKIHKKNKKVYFDINSAIINTVLSDRNFNKIWTKLGITSNVYKREYIMNTIMQMVNIDNRCEMSVMCVPGSTNIFSKTPFIKTSTENGEKYILKNTSVTIVLLSGIHYVELEPQEDTVGTYYVTCKITL